FDGSYIKSIKLPMIFTDFIPNPSGPGYYLYTLDNYNTGFMPEYTLDKDYVITMVNSLFNPDHGIEEIYLDPSANPSRYNGQKLFHYGNSVGFINNYSNDLYTIKNGEVHSLVSFRINGIKFQPKEYIKTADGIRFLETLDKGYSFIENMSLANHRIMENISISSVYSDRQYDKVYLSFDMETKDYHFYSELLDSSNTFTIGPYYLVDNPTKYDAYAVIQPKSIEEMEETNYPRRQMILDMLEQNNNNPILALLKFK